jgi:hypothetical protein
LLSRSPVGEGTMIFLSFNPPNRMSKSSLKVAVVHDWFNCIAGSEKVVKEIMHCFPDADVFSLVDQGSSATICR